MVLTRWALTVELTQRPPRSDIVRVRLTALSCSPNVHNALGIAELGARKLIQVGGSGRRGCYSRSVISKRRYGTFIDKHPHTTDWKSPTSG